MTKKRTERKKPAVAVILTDSKRMIQWVNDDFTLITGYRIEEVIGKKPSILQGKNTESEIILRIRRALSAEHPMPFKDEITNYRKNGEEYPCRLVVHPIFNLSQELTNFIAFEVDATDLKDDSEISLLQIPAKKFKYPSSSLTDLKELDLFTQLVKLVEAERLFLDPKLKMLSLAERLKTNTTYLSQVVNHQTGDNLNVFINRYRVEEVKLKIVDDAYRYLTTYAIANMCGFNTKSTFYKTFKDLTGMTPKAYVKHHKEEETTKELSPNL